MTRSTIVTTFFALVALVIVGSVVILTVRPEAQATFTAFVLQVLAIATTSAVTLAGLRVVQKQTNGTLTKERDENRRLLRLLEQNGIPAHTEEANTPTD